MNNNVERLQAMDVLRGFALLGILLVNIQSFSMPGAAYLNPTAFGDLSGLNLWVWISTHVLADQKFMSLFSLLFGAGIILFCDSAQKKGLSAAKLHYKRNAWLLLFGLLHAYLFWYGDILFAYSLCAFFIYLLRNKSVFTLIVVTLLFAAISSGYSLLFGSSLEHFPADAQSGLMEAWAPNAAALANELSAYKGSFLSAFEFRAEEAIFMQSYVFLTYFFWRASAMMLLGMALYKSGFFHLQWQNKSYLWLAIFGLAIGLPIVSFGVHSNFEQQFSLQYSMFLGNQFNYWGSILMGLSYAAIVVLLVKKGLFKALQLRLAAIGKTAFSNYILHTVVFTTVFYGYGLGLFGDIERWLQLSLVLAMWALQLWLAPVWLRHYRFGPLEWLWRTLTYGKAQPFKH
ncbi:DUF418 domain-containing protein [Planctobacterium marinum]|uniref:DUF418 domain-containing protein n=1 Tax=Planctobacterium marinum TaxID=1631968 RepID=A0AA48HJ82_9ALTE|nr:hypothetical protein MACH26_29520 [Planctobacterium marinum]